MQNPHTLDSWEKALRDYSGKHIAIVHQYLPPDDIRDVWYHQWGMGVISFLATGFEMLGMKLNLLDIESFRNKSSDSLKSYDYCLSLMCGNRDIAYWCIVPSIAAWYGAKPLPVTADAIVAGERKDLANVLARETGFNVPRVYDGNEVPDDDALVVIKPRDYGSSVELFCGPYKSVVGKTIGVERKRIVQEYVLGTDVTVPLLFNPETHQYDVGKGVVTYYSGDDSSWMFDDRVKAVTRVGGVPQDVEILAIDIPEAVQRKIVQLTVRLGGSPVSRVDFRIKNFTKDRTPAPEDFYFIEVNPVPTMTQESQFTLSISESISCGDLLSSRFIDPFRKNLREPALVNTLVACCMLRHADATSTHSV